MHEAAGLNRPMSMEVIDNKLDALAVEGLEEKAKTVLGSLDLDALGDDIKSQASILVDTELDAAREELVGIKASVESNIAKEVQTVKSGVKSEVDEAVSAEEKVVLHEAKVADKEVDQAIETDAEAFKEGVEKNVENVVTDLEGSIDNSF
jgi:hypothetical protein